MAAPEAAPSLVWRCGESAADAFARAAAAFEAVAETDDAPPAEGNPIDTGGYFVPVQTLEEYERTAVPFDEVPTRLRAVLEEHGFAVVTGVVPAAEELQELENEFKADLMDLIDHTALEDAPAGVAEAFERFRQEGPIALPLATTLGHLTQAAGFSVGRCLSQGRFAWRVRRHQRVHEVFRALFPSEGGNLVTSLDLTFFTPIGQPPARRNRFCAHSDQNANDVRPGLADARTYQGVLYVWPASPDGRCSTTVVWPRSHMEVWQGMMEDGSFQQSGEHGLHYSEVREMADKDRASAIADGWVSHARRVVVPPGALLLWNSKTLHTGWTGGPRLAQAVCLEPATRRPEAERISKLRLAALGLPSCHWAQAGMQHDMSLGAAGIFERDGVPAKGSRTHDRVVLPLLPALMPMSLDPDADMDRLLNLVRVEWHLCGMWQAPQECVELLESCVRDEFKRFL